MLKKHFIFEKKKEDDGRRYSDERYHRLAVESKYAGGRTAALIVFTGIAYFEGFKKADVIEYLEIKKQQFDVFLKKFIAAFNECRFLEMNELYAEQTMNKIIYAKYRIIMNALKLSEPKQMYLTLADIGY